MLKSPLTSVLIHFTQRLFMWFFDRILSMYYSFPKTNKLKDWDPVSLGPVIFMTNTIYSYIFLFILFLSCSSCFQSNLEKYMLNIWVYIIHTPQSRFQKYPISFEIGTSLKNCPDMPFLYACDGKYTEYGFV